ncbi:MAG: ABC transporter permease [Thermomicrobiales bacterium]|nr:ABC transporter permease [Thermomicrobiales bacterium]
MSATTDTTNGIAREADREREPAQRRRTLGFTVYLAALLNDKLTLLAVVFLVALGFAAVFAPLAAPFDPMAQNLLLRNKPPMTPAAAPDALPHLLGTDPLGRDLLSRIVFGARISLSVGALSVIISGVVGTVAGLVAGYRRGGVDDLVMRVVDIQMGFPSLLLALLVLYALGASIWNVIIVLAVTRWTIYARMARGIVLAQRESAFVEAAQAIGCSDRRILFIHILPNMLAPLLVLATLETAALILSEASLSFLGLGIQPPDTSWGLMLAEGRQYLRVAWWIVLFPGLALLFTALSLNLLATWLRGVTDPVQRWRYLTRASKTLG